MDVGGGQEDSDLCRDLRLVGGRDELNLAEFPVAVLATRIPKGLKTLTFEDTVYDQQAGETVTRRLTITGSDAYGLPTAVDDEVLVALIQLTKRANGFTEPKVTFTRYELLKLLGWQDVGKNYRRLEESLNRWLGVSLYYDRAWWDKAARCWVDARFHVLDNVYLVDQEDRRRLRARGQQELAICSFKWHEVIYKSFQAENLKRLDLDTYFALESAVSKRIFRFLDKRFYHRPAWEFDLREFAFEHVGLSRNYDVGEIKAKLQPAVDELVAIGFLEPMGRDERYTKDGPGRWKIALVQRASGLRPPADGARAGLPVPSELAKELTARGVTRAVAAELVAAHPEDSIRERIEVFDWLAGRMDRRISRNPGGYLAESIRRGYAAPKGFESSTDRLRRVAEAQGRRREAEEAKRRADEQQKTSEEAWQTRLTAYWESLPPPEQERLRAEALANASSYFVQQYRRNQGDPKRSAWYLKIILDAHITGLIEAAEPGAERG
jgi:Replication initiator protein A